LIEEEITREVRKHLRGVKTKHDTPNLTGCSKSRAQREITVPHSHLTEEISPINSITL
jgi:hypothetical protein